MAEPDDRYTVPMTRAEWRLVQSALDTYFYEIDHSRRPRRRRDRRDADAVRQTTLARLRDLDRRIGEETGDGPHL